MSTGVEGAKECERVGEHGFQVGEIASIKSLRQSHGKKLISTGLVVISRYHIQKQEVSGGENRVLIKLR